MTELVMVENDIRGTRRSAPDLAPPRGTAVPRAWYQGEREPKLLWLRGHPQEAGSREQRAGWDASKPVWLPAPRGQLHPRHREDSQTRILEGSEIERMTPVESQTVARHFIDSLRFAGAATFPRSAADLDRLAALPDGWDDGDARAPAWTTLMAGWVILLVFVSSVGERSRASLQLSEPWAAAASDGSLGFEWEHQGRRLLVTCEASGTIAWHALEATHDLSGTGFTQVSEVARWLVDGGSLVGRR